MDFVHSSGVGVGVNGPGVRVRDFTSKTPFHEILASVPERKLRNRPFPSCFPSRGTTDKPGYSGTPGSKQERF